MRQVCTSIKAVVLAGLLPVMALAQTDDGASADPEAVFVQTMVVPAQDGTATRQFFGRVAALETVNLSFQVGGYLTQLDAQEGTMITEGTLLAGLDLAPFERAVTRAEIALDQATRDFARAQELAARDVSSDVRAKDAATARDLAQIALRDARDALDDAQIHAPFDGMVADRLGAAFTNVSPGQPILRLHNMSETRVEFDLPERVLAQIGNPADVSFEGRVAGRDAPLPLAFREFRAETDRVGQSYTISLAVTSDAVLLPGRTISVQASIPFAGQGVSLPATAIRTAPDGAQSVVAVVAGQDGLVAQYLPVTVTSDTGTAFRVSGVPAGTEIAAVGAHLIKDGQPVKRYAGLTVEGF